MKVKHGRFSSSSHPLKGYFSIYVYVYSLYKFVRELYITIYVPAYMEY